MYKGQKLIDEVAMKTTLNTKMINCQGLPKSPRITANKPTKPRINLTMRSILPIFTFIINDFLQRKRIFKVINMIIYKSKYDNYHDLFTIEKNDFARQYVYGFKLLKYFINRRMTSENEINKTKCLSL